MKKLLLTLLSCASIALTGCQQKVKADKVKAKLEKAEYKIELVSKEEVQKRVEACKFNVEVTDLIWATKDKDVLMAFFCVNIKDAETFVQDNIQVLTSAAQYYSEDARCGNHNNVAYVGTPAAIEVAGLVAVK